MSGDTNQALDPGGEEDEDTSAEARFLTQKNFNRAVIVGVLVILVSTPLTSALAAVLTGGTTTSGTMTMATDSGTNVTFSASETDLSNAFPDSNTFRLRTESGTANFSSSGETNVTVDVINGTWTNVSELDVSGDTLTIDPNDKQAVGVTGDTDSLSITDVSIARQDDGDTDIIYAGASGTTTLTIHGLSPNVVVAAVDQGTGDIVKTATTNADGVATFTGLPNSEHKIDIQQQDDPPYVDTASPSGGTYRSDRNVTLEATVVDPSGDNVEVVITHNGAEVYNSTVSSGTKVQQAVTAQSGSNTWSVELVGADGEVSTSEDFTYRTPGAITILEGNDNNQLTSENVEYVVLSEDSDFRRAGSTTTGEIDLEGVPKERLKVTLSTPSGNYSERVLFLDDPSKNVTTVLYPAPSSTLDNASLTFTQSFTLQDNTGQFPSADTVLVVEAHVNGGWKDIASNEFGAANLANATLRDGETYRLRVRNRDSDIRLIGLYEADITNGDAIQPLLIEGFSTDAQFEGIGFQQNATIIRPESENEDDYIQFNFSTGNQTTVRNFTAEIYEYGNESNKIYEKNNFGLVNSLVLVQPLTDSATDKTWVVSWTATVDGEQEQAQVIVGRQILGPGIPLSNIWKSTISFGLLFLMAAFFGRARAPQGGVIVALVAGVFWTAGWLPAAVGGGAIVLALFVAILYFVNARGGIR